MTKEKQQYFQLGAGNHIGVIAEAKTIEPRFEKSTAPFEVKITAITKEYGKADLYFEMSSDYDPYANGKRRYEVALAALTELGLPDSDMTKLAGLKGNSINFFGKENDKKRVNFYLSKNFDVDTDANDANAKLQAMLGTGSDAGNPAADTGGSDGLMQTKKGDGKEFDPFAGDEKEEPPF